MVHSLIAILGKESYVKWVQPTKPQLGVLSYLNTELVYPPVLVLPGFEIPFMIYTDVLLYEVGAVLVQQQDDANPVSWATIRYLSQTLMKA